MYAITTPGGLVRRLRRQGEVTQFELAQRLGTSQSAIAVLERPGSNPTWQTVVDALDALGYQPRLEPLAKPPGVDESLIRRNLELAPRERLEQLERHLREGRRLWEIGAAHRGKTG